jgi:hypothetical protein
MDVAEALVIGKLQQNGVKLSKYFLVMQVSFFLLSCLVAFLVAPWQGVSPNTVLAYAVVMGALGNLVGFIIGTALGLRIGGSNS